MKLIASLLLASLTISLSSFCAEAEQLHCLEIKGHGFPSDTTQEFVSSRGLKSGGRNGWVLWTHKNATALIIMNTENKTYLLQPLTESWQDGPPQRIFKPRLTSIKKGENTVICSLKCTKYSASYAFPGSDKNLLCMEFWTCSHTPCDKAASDAWSTALGVPPGYGLPLRVRRTFRQRSMTVMDVISVQQVTKPAEFFVLDSSFHRATDRAALMFSKDGVLKAADLDDLFISKDKPPKH